MLVSFVQAQTHLSISPLADGFPDLVVVKTLSLFNFFLCSSLVVEIDRDLRSWRLSSCGTQCRPVCIADPVEDSNPVDVLAAHAVETMVESLGVERDFVTAGCRLRKFSFVVLIVGGFFMRGRILI